MKLLVNNIDLTQFVVTADIKGDCDLCANTLTAEILKEGSSYIDKLTIGAQVVLQNDGATLFAGLIFKRSTESEGLTLSFTAFDRGYHLKKNQATKKYEGITPEAATAELCKEFGIPIKSLATTGVAVSRKFFGVNLFSIIKTMYDIAGDTTKKKYKVSFDADGLSVFERGEPSRTVELRSDSNIISTSTTESAENVVNRVVVESNIGAVVAYKENQESISLLGRLQEIIKQSKTVSAEAQIAKALADGEITQKISVDCLGDNRLVAGGAVVMVDRVAKLKGLFWIQSCTHTFKNGLHFCKLIIALKEVTEIERAGE